MSFIFDLEHLGPYLSGLTCDKCQQRICWVYDFDLNGDYFYCDACVKEYKDAHQIPENSEV